MALKSLLILALLTASCPKPQPPKKCGDVYCPPGTVCRLVWSGQQEDEPRLECVPVTEPSPSPSPAPSPSPIPSPPPSPGYQCVVGPDGNYPVPPANTCPSPCWDDSLGWVGITFVGKIGNRYVFDATPHSKPPFCGHAPGLKCEQWQVQGGGCQDPLGPDFWMQHASWPGWQECDKFSDNPYKCHHNPEPGQSGPTRVCAVPRGDVPTSPRGRCVTVNITEAKGTE